MPIFDYLCKHCEHIEENVLVKSYDVVTPCKECGTEMKRLLSRPAFKFTDGTGTDQGQLMSIAKRT
jgi:putative FmdB family regulatory protein